MISPAPLSPDQAWLFGEGNLTPLHRYLGSHVEDGGTVFRVWAPAAKRVAVVGPFNDWDGTNHQLASSDAGVWTGRIEGVGAGEPYMYRVQSAAGQTLDRSDPLGFHFHEPPSTSSVTWDMEYQWSDHLWMSDRDKHNRHDAPQSIYEMHLGSWRYEPNGYRGIAPQLADHLERTGFTHVELLPVMEHPFYGSWGYQTLGYFAPSSRYGTPQDFMWFVDYMHQRGFGVILDWVPSHFPLDSHGLATFDGTHLYEHADPREGFHPDWKSGIFNYGRNEVRNFLLSSADFWLSQYHVDGLRVDAVASMLYRDYSRDPGEWVPNSEGGRENFEAVAFLQELNERVYLKYPGIATTAEESTAWPGVTRPTDIGGLGFGFKWDMGWMNDTLHYMGLDPLHRKHHHQALTFRSLYASSENFVLALSHDEVVHGKGSLLGKQAGDRWQQFAGVRLLFGYQWGLPGKKLLFMGSEFAVPNEWAHEQELRWDLLQDRDHAGVQDWVTALNALLKSEPSLYRTDTDPSGFAWVVADDEANSVMAFLRMTKDSRPVLVVANFTPVAREDYRVGVPLGGDWEELLCSDAESFGGSGVGNHGALQADPTPAHDHQQSLLLRLPPLGVTFLAPRLA